MSRFDENANQIHSGRKFGRFEGAFAKLVGQEVAVVRADAVGPKYRLLSLRGDGLRKKSWRPGQALQILFPGWQAREYTPFTWTAEGELSLLAYIHTRGAVAADWLASVRPGERCLVFGPRWALDFTDLPRPTVLFGDETSLGTAAAAPVALECIFEVDDIEAARAALEAAGFRGDAMLLKRADDRRHLDAVRERFACTPDAHGIFTGDAASIKYLYAALRKDGVRSKRLKNKAYWAAGKYGLE